MNKRGGWSTVNKADLYKWSTAVLDSGVGRILAGWPCIDIGGFCPQREFIQPLASDPSFSTFTAELFGQSQLPPALQDVLCCVLLMHYEEVLHDFPRSSLIERMEGAAGGNRDVLLLWGRAVGDWFRRQNSQWISMQMLSESSVAENMQRVGQGVSLVEQQVIALQQVQVNTAAELREVRREQQAQTALIAQMASNQERMMQYIVSNGISGPVLHPSTAPTPASFVIPAMFQPIEPQPIRPPRSPSTLPNNLCGGEKILAGQHCEKLFNRWYKEELYLCVPANEAQADVLRRLTRLVAYMKALLPCPTEIPAKPTEPDQLAAWSIALTSCAVENASAHRELYSIINDTY